VISWCLGVATKRITIVPEGDSAGHVENRSIGNRTRADIEWADRFSRGRLKAEKIVMVSMAGELAQRRFDPSSVRSYHASGDRWSITDILMRYAPSDPDGAINITQHYKLLRQWTADLVEHKWYLIEALAEALMERGTLSSKEVREVILAAEYQRYPGLRKAVQAIHKALNR
jgi:hypothetical protein